MKEKDCIECFVQPLINFIVLSKNFLHVYNVLVVDESVTPQNGFLSLIGLSDQRGRLP